MKEEKGGVRVLIVILIILVIATGCVLAYKITQDKNKTEQVANENEVLTAKIEEEKTNKTIQPSSR